MELGVIQIGANLRENAALTYTGRSENSEKTRRQPKKASLKH
jgi:hypothetical protein